MEEVKNWFYYIIVIAIGWHVKVYFDSNTSITSPFQKQPHNGYVWEDSKSDESRYFWKSSKIMWKQGIKHPTMNAFSSEIEGKWRPALGYSFIVENGMATNTTWVPGSKYERLKIIAGQTEGTFNPYPGYKFLNADPNNFDVVWTPGIINPNNPNLISGSTEGSWRYPYQHFTDSEPTVRDHMKNATGSGVAGKLIEWVFGENPVSDKLYEESTREAANAIIKAIK